MNKFGSHSPKMQVRKRYESSVVILNKLQILFYKQSHSDHIFDDLKIIIQIYLQKMSLNFSINVEKSGHQRAGSLNTVVII